MSYKLLLPIFMMLLIFPSASRAGIPVRAPQKNVREWRKFKTDPDEKPDKKPKERDVNRNANLAFGLGLGSLLFPILAIPALVFGITALTKKEPNQAFAITGVVIGGLYVLLAIVLIVLLFFALL